MKISFLCISVLLLCIGCDTKKPVLKLAKGAHIVLIGNNLGSRMMNYGFFETEMHVRYPDSALYIRNMYAIGNFVVVVPHPVFFVNGCKNKLPVFFGSCLCFAERFVGK